MTDLSYPIPELLAPAGDREALDAALEAGANAVYFGLSSLNARRRAVNFRSEELADAVAAIHARGARAYLTLNIDLAEREVGQAARILELARQSHVDAVLVRDPAVIGLRSEYPELEFHFSTQICICNSEDVQAVGALGASRVVLAREMSLREIAAASTVPGVQTEVFVQGALCFSVSGRCLLSSWIGGRSGNRGTCTSPCRVPWSAEHGSLGTPLSMRDLAAVERLLELRRTGVAALKIEGRLKNAAWVQRAVALYRRALDGDAVSLADAVDLGAYTGRLLTSGYLDGRRNELTGEAGRERFLPRGDPSAGDSRPTDDVPVADENEDADCLPDDVAEPMAEEAAGDHYDLDVMITARAIEITCRCGGRTFEWSMPKTVIRRANKAVTVDAVFQWLAEMPIQGYRLGRAATNDPEFLMVRRATAALSDQLSTSIRLARKTVADQVRIDLPPTVRQWLEKDAPAEGNCRFLGDEPDRVRLDASTVGEFLRNVRPAEVVVEGLSAGRVEKARATCGDVPLVVALPAVFFEDDLGGMRDLMAECTRAKVAVEVNSWGGWHLAQAARAKFEAGPGLAVLNSLAARKLTALGARCVTLSPEADRKQLEELTAHCSAACSMVVFGRPALLTTRVGLPEQEFTGKVLADRRGAQITPRREQKLWVFRPTSPFDLRDLRNERIRVQHLVVDLVGSPDPVAEWYDVPDKRKPFRFNYDRALA